MKERARILGIDLGIASCGWGVIELEPDKDGTIVAAGVRCFDAPIDKKGEPTSAARRTARGQRRVIRRRRQRMTAIRRLFKQHGLLPDASSPALLDALRRASSRDRDQSVTPWVVRAAAYERLLTPDELAVALGHIARHRGFRSNSKKDAGNDPGNETSKMKRAMEQTREGLARYRSFGDMMANDPRFALRKRNRDKDFSHTAKRSDLEDEVRALMAAQRRRYNALATPELEAEFVAAAFSQRPLRDSEDKVGPCPFERAEKRTSRFAPSFELFRYLSKLANLSLTIGRQDRRLTAEEIALASRGFGEQKSITYKTLRRLLDLDPNVRFSGIARDKEDNDVAARHGNAAAGTYALRTALGDSLWRSLLATPGAADRIAEVLSFREDIASIRRGLIDIPLDPLLVRELMDALERGDFSDFGRPAHISALAARNILPGLQAGLVYSEACARAGYDHSIRPEITIDRIGSTVTRRAFCEAIKQVRAVAREYGPFDAIHVELAREVGKSADERREITEGLEERNAEKERRRAVAAGVLGRPVSDDELLRYELAMEQAFKCVYCGAGLAPDGFAANDTRYQVDHILPWSRFGDDSFRNKTLCCAKCNQDKRGRTTFEWFSADKAEAEWDLLMARLDSLKEMKGFKKGKFKLKDATKELEDKFKQRNLTDTQWATRLLAAELARMYPPEERERRVFTRPGAVTSKLRHAWGLGGLKRVDGERVADDRHHAVDALVLAATTDSLLQRLTLEIQACEREGRQGDVFHCASPWPGFRLDVVRAVYGHGGIGGVFVSRAERRRARGKAHDATVKQIRLADGEATVFERKAVEKLTEKDLDRIPVPEPYGRIADPKKLRDRMVDTLRAWIVAGKPKDRPPKSPKGDVIRKVRIATNDNVAVELRGGTVDRGDMARVDVFRKLNGKRKWEFYAVPVYPHQIATMNEPPGHAIKGGGKEESEWVKIDGTAEFLWSLHSMSFVEMVKPSGEVIEGYFRSLDRNTGAVTVSPHSTCAEIRKGIGIKTLLSLKKFSIDRFGRKFEVAREVRTWRGKACT